MARFIRGKSNSAPLERQIQGRPEGNSCPEVFVKLPYISLGFWKEQVFSQTIQSLSCLGFSGAYALPLLDLFIRFSHAGAPPRFMIAIFPLTAQASLFCFIIWLQLSFQLSKRNFLMFLFSPSHSPLLVWWTPLDDKNLSFLPSQMFCSVW